MSKTVFEKDSADLLKQGLVEISIFPVVHNFCPKYFITAVQAPLDAPEILYSEPPQKGVFHSLLTLHGT